MNGSDTEQQQLQLSWHLFFTTSHLRSSKWAQTALIHAAHNIHQCTLTPSENTITPGISDAASWDT